MHVHLCLFKCVKLVKRLILLICVCILICGFLYIRFIWYFGLRSFTCIRLCIQNVLIYIIIFYYILILFFSISVSTVKVAWYAVDVMNLITNNVLQESHNSENIVEIHKYLYLFGWNLTLWGYVNHQKQLVQSWKKTWSEVWEPWTLYFVHTFAYLTFNCSFLCYCIHCIFFCLFWC